MKRPLGSEEERLGPKVVGKRDMRVMKQEWGYQKQTQTTLLAFRILPSETLEKVPLLSVATSLLG